MPPRVVSDHFVKVEGNGNREDSGLPDSWFGDLVDLEPSNGEHPPEDTKEEESRRDWCKLEQRS